MVKELDWPLTLNVVLHRHNIDRMGRILDLAEELGADRIELANTQYYGWAWRNREALLPSRAQLDQAEAEVRAARQRLREDADNLRHPRLLQQVPQTLYGRLGPAAANGDTQRACPTLPAAHTRSSPSRRARALAGMDLGRVSTLPALPGNGVDARAMPEL